MPVYPLCAFSFKSNSQSTCASHWRRVLRQHWVLRQLGLTPRVNQLIEHIAPPNLCKREVWGSAAALCLPCASVELLANGHSLQLHCHTPVFYLPDRSHAPKQPVQRHAGEPAVRSCRPRSQCVRVTSPLPSMLCHTRTQLSTPACHQARAVIKPANVCSLKHLKSQPRLTNVAAASSTDLSSSTAALATPRTHRARRAAAVCHATVGKAEPGATTLGFCGMGIMGVPMVGAAAAPVAAALSSSSSNPHKSLQPNGSSMPSSAP
jgi:hypothetical protein